MYLLFNSESNLVIIMAVEKEVGEEKKSIQKHMDSSYFLIKL